MDIIIPSDEDFMRDALKEAQKAFDADEIPVGAVVVCNNKIIARAHNLTERLNDVTAHAEMQAITSAANFLGGKYLNECTLYVTLEPCVMCAGAIAWSQLARLVYGAPDTKRGFNLLVENKNLIRPPEADTFSSKGEGKWKQILHPKTEVKANVLGNESAELMKLFFQNKR